MSSRKWSNRVMSKVNQLAGIIREEKEISWSRLMVKSGLGSSTLYAYKKVLLETCPDIYFDGEVFRVRKK